MNLTKDQVCVLIENEDQLNEARRILEQSGEDIAIDDTFSLTAKAFNYLQLYCDIEWCLLRKLDFLTQITLAELEEILKENK